MRRRWASAVLAAALLVLGAGACDGGGDGDGGDGSGDGSTSSTASTLALPRTNPRPSTLQFRPVLGEAADCPARQENPPADQPTSMLRLTQCLSLAPSGLTVQRAEVVAYANPNPSAGPVVRLFLTAEDAKTFAELSGDYVGRTVALVAFGRVMATPVLGQQVDTGALDITGLTPNEAADLKAALS